MACYPDVSNRVLAAHFSLGVSKKRAFFLFLDFKNLLVLEAAGGETAPS